MSSAFADILRRLVERVPGAVGAVFADWDGEAVDVFAVIEPLEIKLAGAQWGVVLDQAEACMRGARLGHVSGALIESSRATTLLERVTEQYYVVLQLKPTSQLGRALEELSRSVEQIRGEM